MLNDFDCIRRDYNDFYKSDFERHINGFYSFSNHYLALSLYEICDVDFPKVKFFEIDKRQYLVFSEDGLQRLRSHISYLTKNLEYHMYDNFTVHDEYLKLENTLYELIAESPAID